MAVGGEEEGEYESDPEEALLPLAMRRREASDDEEGEGEGREKPSRMDPRGGIGSDGESDGQGGAPAYDDEESEIDEEGVEQEEEEEEEEIEEVEEVEEEGEGDFEERGGEGVDDAREVEVLEAVPESGGDERRSVGEPTEFRSNNQVEEEKETEPFAVPTAGAFYMHDDRFREAGGGRHRRTPGGRKLWETKDERKWGHDKFEEMNLQEIRYEEERRPYKGHYRGRGKNRGMDRGYARGNRSRAYDNGNNHSRTSKSVRGRGPRRYEPPVKNNNENPRTQNKQSGKSIETASISSGRVSTHTSNVQSDSAPPKKNVFASSLSSASPPFYPSGSSNQDISVTQKRDVQSGSINRNLPPSVLMEENFAKPRSNALLRGKAVADPISLDKLYIDESVRPVSGKPLTNLQLQASGPLPINATQSPQSRGQGRGLSISGQLNQPTPPLNHVNRISPQTQPSSIQARPVQSPVQPPLRASSQQLGQHPASGSQVSSPPKAPLRNSPEPEKESPPGSSKSKTALVEKGKSTGKGSFLYSGPHVVGASGTMGVAHGDPSFPGTPALLPVMQFGGQHSGGLAVGMALPGYVAQPGFGNSEMTWLPFLAGAAGALGGTYPPYIAVDGGYYARPSGQTSSLGVSGKETSTNKPNNVWKPPQRPGVSTELVNDEFGQRQNKPRRYSEMNFGQ